MGSHVKLRGTRIIYPANWKNDSIIFQAREADSRQEQCQTSDLIHRHKNGDAGQQPASFFLCDARNRELSQEAAEKN